MLLCHLPSAVRPRGDEYQASPESRNPLVPVPLRPPSPPAPRGGRGPGRGAQRPFANQKNRRAQNDLGRRPSIGSHVHGADPRPRWIRCFIPFSQVNGPSASWATFSPSPSSTCSEFPAPLLGRVRSCSPSPLDLTSGGPARGLHAPPGPNGLLQGRHVPPALLPHIVLLPRVSFPLSPSAHEEFAVDTHKR